MSVIVDKDCVVLKDGTLLCYDPDAGCCYVMTKKKVDAGEVSPNDMMALVAHLGRRRETGN